MRTQCFSLWILLSVVLIAVGCSKDDTRGDDADGNMTCTTWNAVIITTGAGSENGRCVQVSDSFPLFTQVCVCAEWACLANGDQVQFVWDNPVDTNDHIDTFKRSDGGTSGYTIAYCSKLAATGQWVARIRRNGEGVANRVFTVF